MFHKMWIDVGCWHLGAEAALLGKLRRLDPAISTEEQYMVDVSWRQDCWVWSPWSVWSFRKHIPSTEIKHGYLWWIFPLQMVIFHSYVKLPEGRLHRLALYILLKACFAWCILNIILVLFNSARCGILHRPAFRVTWRAKLWQKIFASQRTTTALRPQGSRGDRQGILEFS